MKVGIMLMSDRGPDGKPWDWKKHLSNCRERGVEVVDLFDVMLKSIGLRPIDAKDVLDGLGLRPSVFGVQTDLVSADPKVRERSLSMVKYGIEVCRQLEIGHLFSHGGQHTNSGEAALARYVEGLSEAADIAGEAGIMLSIENAGTLCHTDEELMRCVEAVNKPNLKVTFDGGNFVLAGCDPHKAAELLAPKVVHVHAKSFEPAPNPGERPFPGKPYKYCPIGKGLVDYGKILKTLAAEGFDGCVSFEPEGGEDSKWYQSIDALVGMVART
ncbi:MAG: sugar phosphate isomerase/epimerase [Candidatus Brockarchaeota archaeon]|nr:sugar phosphate isomerase/epimerase [Candidatus Brockarchaeota archaeon]